MSSTLQTSTEDIQLQFDSSESILISQRRVPINDVPVEPDVEDVLAVLIEPIPKSQETMIIIHEALKKHFLFSSLDQGEITAIIDKMMSTNYEVGQDIIKQGDNGNSFIVLESGHCNILVNEEVVGVYSSGHAFGELALLYNCPRAATIRTTSPCKVWSIDRTNFRRVLVTKESVEQISRMDHLKSVSILAPLSSMQKSKVASAMKTEHFRKGDYIIRQGDHGDAFYILVSGDVLCTHLDRSGTESKELMKFRSGDYFGEMALLLNEPRQANCIAQNDVQCYSLDRNQFNDLLGPLREVLDRQMRIRVLRIVPLLESLKDDELDVLANALTVLTFSDNQCIIKEGEEGETFYIISSGRVSIKKGEVEVMKLESGEFFGERALLKKEPRAASVFAIGHVECLTLNRKLFEGLLGKLEHILEREMVRQHAMQQVVLRSAKKTVIKTKTMDKKQQHTYTMSKLQKIRVIGEGTFGRVHLVRDTETGQALALKCMEKATIVSTNQQTNVMQEKNIVAECDHPFILALYATFQDANQLYFLFELVQGGELWTLLYQKTKLLPPGPYGSFDYATTMFYSAIIIDVFHYIHDLGIAYRDLKPENLLVDGDGYLKMVDFGFAKHIPYYKGGLLCQRSFTLCGTPEYLSPELVLSKGHTKSVDYWALGCLLYELVMGKTPFLDAQQPKMFEKIINSKSRLVFPTRFDPLLKDLIIKLLEPNPALRLGSLAGGVKDIKDHSWFKQSQFNWEALRNKKLPAPYRPEIKDVTDSSHFDVYNENEYIQKYHGSDFFRNF